MVQLDIGQRENPFHSINMGRCRNSEALATLMTSVPYNLGSTGSLSNASTPKTHSWTRRSGSR